MTFFIYIIYLFVCVCVCTLTQVWSHFFSTVWALGIILRCQTWHQVLLLVELPHQPAPLLFLFCIWL